MGALQKAIIPLALIASACGPSTSNQGDGWRQVGGLDGNTIPFIAVDAAREKDGNVYRDAINRICSSSTCVQIGFFEAGDTVPPSGSRADFFREGGWAKYRPLAVYMGKDFTKW